MPCGEITAPASRHLQFLLISTKSLWPPVIGGTFSRFHAVPFEIVELLYRGQEDGLGNLKVVVGGDS